MQKINWKNIIILCSIFLIFGSIVIGNDFVEWVGMMKQAIQGESDSDLDCNDFVFSEGVYTIDPRCVQEKILPNMTLVEIVNEVWDQISDFSEYYRPFESSFDYYGANPVFETEGSPFLAGDDEANELLEKAKKNKEKIGFSYNELAQYYASHLSYFVADKDLTNLGNCTRKNYLLALESMDNYVLNPSESLNVNQKLSSIKGYCQGNSENTYSFYGGVCGMVTQLFRVSLLSPDIIVKKRFPHNERFVQYYGENVGGDDAAVYERSKQFEIENMGNSDIVFKVRYDNDKSTIVAISWPTNEWVNISKEFINGRSTATHLEKNVYMKKEKSETIDCEGINNYESFDNLVRTESFDSYYTKKSYEFR